MCGLAKTMKQDVDTYRIDRRYDIGEKTFHPMCECLVDEKFRCS